MPYVGDDGEVMEAPENRYFLPQFYGRTVPVAEEWKQTTLPGVVFQGAAYGTQVDDRFGLATVVHVRFGNFFLGQATLYSWGTVAEDRVDGQFGYLLDFTEGIVNQLGTIADQYPVEGQRVEP